ncbi:hypothetical protein X474_23360 [Dethiosulfatarculus sandiegensis]|uniref:Transposase n=1 Tax=Dethiosulfatarculus sandiegensis TaxID=1429043 RepID=A0A0D2JQ62_9BACT|nr:hypothetical protein X474_23360 [Dethiosulfatarculus sandiegensis]
MKKSKFTDERIAFTLRQAEHGTTYYRHSQGYCQRNTPAVQPFMLI